MKINIRTKIVFAVIPLSMLLTSLVLSAERWMRGDFHQHRSFTDGSWPMNDLDPNANPFTSAVPLPAGLTSKW